MFIMLSGIITAHAVEIKMVRFKNMVDNDFARISEFITGNKDTQSRCVFRTQEDRKNGFYFIVTLDTYLNLLPKDSSLVLEWIPYGKNKVQQSQFSFHNFPKHSKEIDIGLTGKDAPQKTSSVPIAWKISIHDRKGQSFAHEKSFLWE